MLSKTFFSTVALALAAASPAVRAQLINVPLGVSLDVGTQATCPADAPPGTDVDATVLAVVTLNTVVGASLDVVGTGLVGADIGLDVDVCLCIDATVGVGAIELPVNLEAAVIEDVSNLVDGLNLAVNIPGGLEDLLGNPLTDVTVTTSGEQVSPCTCPEGATAICSNATCSCDCGPGFFYNTVTQECVVAPSGLARVKRHRASFDTRQAKRAAIEARLAKLAK
jgi:hypothetical protein